MPPGRSRLTPLLLMLGAAGTLAAGAAARRWLDAVEVRGGSMAPELLPGDRLIIESRTFAERAPRPGEVVLASDPREAGRELIKRVSAVDDANGMLELLGDAPAASTDSRVFGSVPIGSVRWRVVYRYWPPERLGPVRRTVALAPTD